MIARNTTPKIMNRVWVDKEIVGSQVEDYYYIYMLRYQNKRDEKGVGLDHRATSDTAHE